MALGCSRIAARVVSIAHGIFCSICLIIWILFLVFLSQVDKNEKHEFSRAFHLEAKKLGVPWLVVGFCFMLVEVAVDVLLFMAANDEKVTNEQRSCLIKATIWIVVAVARIIIVIAQGTTTEDVNGSIHALPVVLNVFSGIVVICFAYDLMPRRSPPPPPELEEPQPDGDNDFNFKHYYPPASHHVISGTYPYS